MLDAEGHVKLIDFGLSKELEGDDALTNTFCGTVEYMAPEVVVKSPGHGKPADWWSYGVFAFDLFTGRSPFHSSKGKKETKERILRGRFTVPSFVSPAANDLVRKLLRRNVDRRLGACKKGGAAVRAHPFFAGLNWKSAARRGLEPPHAPELENAADPADISQFDPRFTALPAKESECAEDKKGSDDSGMGNSSEENDSEKGSAVMFGDFDYVAEDAGVHYDAPEPAEVDNYVRRKRTLRSSSIEDKLAHLRT